MDPVPNNVEEHSGGLEQGDLPPQFHLRALEALQTLCETVGGAQTVEDVCVRALGVLRQLTGYTTMAIRVYNQRSNCLKLIAQVGMTPAMVAELDCLPADWGLLAEVIRLKEPVFSSNMRDEPERVGSTPSQAGYKSVISVPLLAGGVLVGTMEIASTSVKQWSDDEIDWLAALGRGLGLHIQNVRLTEQVNDLAITQERLRLAQEMHDGLGPLLSSIHVWAEEVQAALADGDTTGAQKAALKIDSAAQEAYNAVREQLLGLRISILPGETFVSVMRRYLERFRSRWGIAAELHLSEGLDEAALCIETSHEIQLLRVMQEALTNVHRHAKADRVVVLLDDDPQALTMTIEDNGVGFDPSAVDEERLGIRIMIERATRAKGTLDVRSAPGKGTSIRMQLPKLGPRPGGGH